MARPSINLERKNSKIKITFNNVEYQRKHVQTCSSVDICRYNYYLFRRLFERILQMKWSTKKMKFFFKKYLEFEKKKGTPEGVNHVKEAAVRYVQTLN